jgi:hypothetical protein
MVRFLLRYSLRLAFRDRLCSAAAVAGLSPGIPGALLLGLAASWGAQGTRRREHVQALPTVGVMLGKRSQKRDRGGFSQHG